MVNWSCCLNLKKKPLPSWFLCWFLPTSSTCYAKQHVTQKHSWSNNWTEVVRCKSDSNQCLDFCNVSEKGLTLTFFFMNLINYVTQFSGYIHSTILIFTIYLLLMDKFKQDKNLHNLLLNYNRWSPIHLETLLFTLLIEI